VFGVGIDLVRAFAVLLVAASALMLFVALAQALDERRYDLAILRTLGASRLQVAWVLVAESVTLALVGAATGLAIAHAVAAFAGRIVPAAAPLAAAAGTLHPEEALVLGIALAAGILAALWPAWQAYRLDVAATLADN
jgi:putative ABC transport system permease protein